MSKHCRRLTKQKRAAKKQLKIIGRDVTIYNRQPKYPNYNFRGKSYEFYDYRCTPAAKRDSRSRRRKVK